MRRVQKAAAVLAALALTTALAVPVWADDTNSSNLSSQETTASHNVYGSYNPDTVYHVDITWGALTYTYEPGKWMGDAAHTADEELKYLPETGENGSQKSIGWSNNTDDCVIQIENKSNTNIGVEFSVQMDSTVCGNGVKGYIYDAYATKKTAGKTDAESLNIAKIWMQRADKNVVNQPENGNGASEAGAASTAKMYLALMGRPKNKLTNATIGSVTVTVKTESEDTHDLYYESGVIYGGNDNKKPSQDKPSDA